MDIQNMAGLQYLHYIEDKSVDLILTDSPYIISRSSGMDVHYQQVKRNALEQIPFAKTEQEWADYIQQEDAKHTTPKHKDNFLKYGSVYGKK